MDVSEFTQPIMLDGGQCASVCTGMHVCALAPMMSMDYTNTSTPSHNCARRRHKLRRRSSSSSTETHLARIAANTPTPRRTDRDDGSVPLRVPVGLVSGVSKPVMIEESVAITSSSMPSAKAGGVACRDATLPRKRLYSKTFVSALSPASLDVALLVSVCVNPGELHTPFPDKPCSITPIVRCVEDFLLMDADKLDGLAANTWQALLEAAYPELIGKSVQTMLLLFVARTLRNRSVLTPKLRKCIEYFAGDSELMKAHLEMGFSECTRWDKVFSELHDVEKNSALRMWLDDLGLSAVGCLTWLGTQCSSFLVVCMAQSQRKLRNLYRGDEGRPFVEKGNRLLGITSLIWFLSCLQDGHPALEQPANSVLPKAEPLASVLSFTGANKTMTWLGAFGGSSPKPLQIWHIAKEYSELRRPRPDSNETPDKLYSVAVGPGGQKRFSGKKRLMKESQAYTCNFARAVAAVTLRNARPV
jgi:hypothetical protein